MCEFIMASQKLLKCLVEQLCLLPSSFVTALSVALWRVIFNKKLRGTLAFFFIFLQGELQVQQECQLQPTVLLTEQVSSTAQAECPQKLKNRLDTCVGWSKLWHRDSNTFSMASLEFENHYKFDFNKKIFTDSAWAWQVTKLPRVS